MSRISIDKGQRLKRLIEKHGISKMELASLLSVDSSTVGHWIIGRRSISNKCKLALRELFGQDFVDIIGDDIFKDIENKGGRFTSLLEKSKISRCLLARKIGASDGSIRHWELGARPSLQYIIRLSRYLGPEVFQIYEVDTNSPGYKFAELLVNKKTNKKTLAAKLKVNPSLLSAWERGIKPSLEYLSKLSTILGDEIFHIYKDARQAKEPAQVYNAPENEAPFLGEENYLNTIKQGIFRKIESFGSLSELTGLLEFLGLEVEFKVTEKASKQGD